MSRKNGLLSIGDMAKLTGASIKSLRYYERIGILKPEYTDHNSNYRYYSCDQIYMVEIILICIELDIPLKELTNLSDSDDILDYRKFLSQGKEIARQKLKSIQKRLSFIIEMERKMDLVELNEIGEIYSIELPEKVFCVNPCRLSLEYIDWIEVAKFFLDMPNVEDYDTLPEYGLLCECSSKAKRYFTFVEIPKHLMDGKEVIVIPAGKYYCRQSEDAQIEQAAEIFNAELTGKDSFLAIETEILTGRYKIGNPLKELRIIPLQHS